MRELFEPWLNEVASKYARRKNGRGKVEVQLDRHALFHGYFLING